MKCRDAQRLIPAFIDGLLDFDDSFAVRQHINTCNQCYEVFRAYERDESAVSSYMHRAPFAPVARDVMNEIDGGRSPWWDAFMAGSYRLASVAGLVLVILVVAAGAWAVREVAMSNGEEPQQESMLATDDQAESEDGTDAVTLGQPSLIGESDVSQIIERLDEHGLVYELGFTGGGDGYTVDYRRVAFDRHLTLVEYRAEADQATEFSILVDSAAGGGARRGVALEPGEVREGWAVLPGMLPDTTSITLGDDLESGAEGSRHDVPVDLTALRDVPEDEEYGSEDTQNGIEACCLEIERGVAVSVIRLSYEVLDPDEVVTGSTNGDQGDDPADTEINTQRPAPYPNVRVNGDEVTLLDHFFGLSNVGDGMQSFAVYGLPDSGELTVEYEYMTMGTGPSDDDDQPQNVQGPWVLTAQLETPEAEPDPTPEPTVPPDVAQEDPTPTPEPTPSPGENGDDADGDDTLRVLVYLVRNGEVAAAAREVEHTPDVATAAIQELLDGLSRDEENFELGTAVPEGTELLDISLQNGTITVDLSEEFSVSEAGGESLSMRMAQVVHTLTQFETVDSVEILVEGQPIAPRGGAAGDIEDEHYTREDFEDEAPAILVETPAPGEVVSGPLELRGTSNTFEANMQIEVIDASGEVIYEGYATATSGTGTRGTFEFTTPLSLKEEGWGTVRVFETSARDGSRTNVVDIPVRFEVGCVSCLEDGSGQQQPEEEMQ